MCGYSMGYSDTKHSCFILVCSDFPFYIVQAVPSDLIPAPLGQSVRAERRADRYHATTGSSVRSGTLRLGGGLASDNMGNHVLLTSQSCLAVSLTFHGMIDFELTGAWIGKRDSCWNNLPSVFNGSLEHFQQKTNWLWVEGQWIQKIGHFRYLRWSGCLLVLRLSIFCWLLFAADISHSQYRWLYYVIFIFATVFIASTSSIESSISMNRILYSMSLPID